MPFKAALAVALTAVLTASSAFAAKVQPETVVTATSQSHSRQASSKHGKKVALPKPAAPGKRKHTVDTRPDAHGGAISLAKPLDVKVDAKKAPPPAKPVEVKRGKKREGRRSEPKKSAPKSDNGGSVPVVAAALPAELPPLPSSEPAREPLVVKRGKKNGKAQCTKAPVEVLRGSEAEELSLLSCDGEPLPFAVEKMRMLLRPGDSDKPMERLDPGLVSRLGAVVLHFAKTAGTLKMTVISGSRPSSVGSYHASGRAVDFRLDGVKNEDIVAFCKSLDDTGCGYYPNSSFVHVDVRDEGTGHVHWIDASRPGDPPRYVSAWPAPTPGPEGSGDAPKGETRAMLEDLLATLKKEIPDVATGSRSAEDQPAEMETEREAP